VARSFYTLCRALARSIFALLGPVRVLHPERSAGQGACLFVSNHISHFDPPLLAVAARRQIDFMAMVELFRNPLSAAFCRANGAFPADRSRVDRAAVRTALRRLEQGRAVGIFPEGGIRVRAESVLQGGPMRPGAVTLAHLANVGVIPCVVLGSDTLYNGRRWLPFRRNRFWVAFGEPLRLRRDLPGKEARARLEQELTASFQALCAELMETFGLGSEVMPRTPEEHRQQRKG